MAKKKPKEVEANQVWLEDTAEWAWLAKHHNLSQWPWPKPLAEHNPDGIQLSDAESLDRWLLRARNAFETMLKTPDDIPARVTYLLFREDWLQRINRIGVKCWRGQNLLRILPAVSAMVHSPWAASPIDTLLRDIQRRQDEYKRVGCDVATVFEAIRHVVSYMAWENDAETLAEFLRFHEEANGLAAVVPALQAVQKASMTKRDLALATLVMHPGWTTTKIAQQVGCSRVYLEQDSTFRSAREAQRPNGPALPINWVCGWKKMVVALGREPTETEIRHLRNLAMKNSACPIIPGKKRGCLPRVDGARLIEWWNRLEDDFDTAQATGQATLERNVIATGERLFDGSKTIGTAKLNQQRTGSYARPPKQGQ